MLRLPDVGDDGFLTSPTCQTITHLLLWLSTWNSNTSFTVGHNLCSTPFQMFQLESNCTDTQSYFVFRYGSAARETFLMGRHEHSVNGWFRFTCIFSQCVAGTPRKVSGLFHSIFLAKRKSGLYYIISIQKYKIHVLVWPELGGSTFEIHDAFIPFEYRKKVCSMIVLVL